MIQKNLLKPEKKSPVNNSALFRLDRSFKHFADRVRALLRCPIEIKNFLKSLKNSIPRDQWLIAFTTTYILVVLSESWLRNSDSQRMI